MRNEMKLNRTPQFFQFDRVDGRSRHGWAGELRFLSAGSGEGDKLHLGHSKLEVPGGRPGADVRRHIWVFMGLRLMEEGH